MPDLGCRREGAGRAPGGPLAANEMIPTWKNGVQRACRERSWRVGKLCLDAQQQRCQATENSRRPTWPIDDINCYLETFYVRVLARIVDLVRQLQRLLIPVALDRSVDNGTPPGVACDAAFGI